MAQLQETTVNGNVTVSGEVIEQLGGAGAATVKPFRITQTYVVPGDLEATSGTSTGYIPPFFVGASAAEGKEIAEARYKVSDGSCVVSLEKNGSPVSGYQSINVGTTAASTTATASIANGDELRLIVDSQSSASNLSFSLFFETT
jgi:hypothetical protein